MPLLDLLMLRRKKFTPPSSPIPPAKKNDSKSTPSRLIVDSPDTPFGTPLHLKSPDQIETKLPNDDDIFISKDNTKIEECMLPHGEDIPIPVFIRDPLPSDFPMPFFNRDNPSSPPRVTRTNNTVYCLRSPIDITTEREKCGFSFGPFDIARIRAVNYYDDMILGEDDEQDEEGI